VVAAIVVAVTVLRSERAVALQEASAVQRSSEEVAYSEAA
jgi:hypothetical protein